VQRRDVGARPQGAFDVGGQPEPEVRAAVRGTPVRQVDFQGGINTKAAPYLVGKDEAGTPGTS
jgi:hypothetical protein